METNSDTAPALYIGLDVHKEKTSVALADADTKGKAQHYNSSTAGRTLPTITKIGSVHLRRGLFMPAMTARVFNPLLKTFADRLLENGKKTKQIIIAMMRELLHQIYGILESVQPYNPEKRGYAVSKSLSQEPRENRQKLQIIFYVLAQHLVSLSTSIGAIPLSS
jgi:hypothetical protein